MSFTPNIPLATQSLGQTRQSIVDNMAILRSTLAVDHVDVNSSPNGYHKVIHYQNQAANPSTVAGVGQLYTRTLNSDQQLVFKSGGGVVTQLTGPNAPLAAQRGYVWLPGGILFQWGIVVTTSSSGTVTFTDSSGIVFPNDIWLVQTTPFRNSSSIPGSQANYTYRNDTFSTTDFTWRLITNSSDWGGFSWTALGN